MKKAMIVLLMFFVFGCIYHNYRTPELSECADQYRIYTYSTAGYVDGTTDRLSGERVVTTDVRDLKTTLLRLGDFNSYETSFSGELKDAYDIIDRLGAVQVKVEKTDTGIVFYCFSDRLSRYVSVDGEKVNLHIAVASGRVTAGTPVIRGSV